MRAKNGFAFDDFTTRINLSPGNFEPTDDDKCECQGLARAKPAPALEV
jgi:hypothetical protein